MRLPRPFYRLPVRFDVERLRAEVAALPADAWARHPNAIEGNSSVRLISVEGGENDDVNGRMLPTAHLQASPYLRQVLASFGVVWSRSRLMRLAPGMGVPEHADINHHWFSRVRLHVPVSTQPQVRFHCDGQAVHMAPGEAWIFDNWRLHRVEHPTDEERIHLVADTSGSAAFWQFVARAEGAGAPRSLPFDAARDAWPLTERAPPRPVMPPAEVDLLLGDLRAELALRTETPAGRTRLARYHGLLDAFCRDWRQLYALHGEDPDGIAAYSQLRDALRAASRDGGDGLAMRTNGVAAHTVLEGRLLRHLLVPPAQSGAPASAGRARAAAAAPVSKPVFIVAAPRSGSTLLFETLAVTPQFATLGGEAHWLVEGLPGLRPGAPGVDSNRLTAAHCTPEVTEHILGSLLAHLRTPDGRSAASDGGAPRLLEKTPKNALRVPFFLELFPDARFIFLWRDPRENLASIIEAWRDGSWITYRQLDGWDGPWSLLLPPGWQALRGRPLEEIAAFQWEATNRIVLDDLAALPPDRWTSLQYAELVQDPAAAVRRLGRFAGIEFDAALARRVAEPLPPSRYTRTAPSQDKWRRHERAILRVLPGIEETWERLRGLRPATDAQPGGPPNV
jgi:hypothetical protein